MKKSFFYLGLLISVACLYFIFSRIDLSTLQSNYRNIRWSWVAACVLLVIVQIWLRAVRWKYFFPAGSGITGRRLFSPISIGYTLSNLFPGRVGEIARVLLVAQRDRQSFSTTLATVVGERTIDAVTVLLGFAYVLLVVNLRPFSIQLQGFVLNEKSLRASARGLVIVGVLPLCTGIILMMIPGFRRLLSRGVLRLPLLPEKIKYRIPGMIDHFAHGIQSLRQPAVVASIVAYTLLVWYLVILSVQAAALALDCRLGFNAAVALTVIPALSMLIPAAPGNWGIYEVTYLFTAGLLGLEFSNTQMTVMAVIYHLIFYTAITLLGFACALVGGIPLFKIAKTEERADK